MTWVKPDPFGAAMGTVGAFVSAAAQAKKDKADADRQAGLDKVAATTAGVHNAYETAQTNEALARTTGLANTAIHQHADDVSHGYILPPGALPPEMPTQAPGKPPPNNRAFADFYSKLGAFYTRNKALDAASTAVGLAEKYGGMAAAEEKQALAVKAQAEKAFQDLATQKHWSADLKQKMKEELGRMVRESMRNGTSLEVATLNGVNAMARTLVTQQGENTRHTDTEHHADKRAAAAQAAALHLAHIREDHTDRRFNVGEKRKAAVTTATDTRLAGNTANARGVEAYNAIAKGDRYDALSARAKASVRSAMVDHGMSVQDAITAVSSSNNPDKAAILQALGGQ